MDGPVFREALTESAEHCGDPVSDYDTYYDYHSCNGHVFHNLKVRVHLTFACYQISQGGKEQHSPDDGDFASICKREQSDEEHETEA